MEEKVLVPLAVVTAVAAGVGIFTLKKRIQPALHKTRIFFAEKCERLEDIFAHRSAKKRKTKIRLAKT